MIHNSMKKTYKQFTEEVAANSMGGGGFNVSQAAQTGSGHLSGIDLPFGTMKRRKKKNESFAGCPVFTVSNDDYAKCMHGRMRYERWNKKLNMEEIENQEIRTYAHRNPGKPIIVKDDRYGTMSYFIPPKQEVNESVEKKPKNMTPEAMFAFWKTLKSRQEIDIWFDSGIAKGTNWKTFVVGRKSKSKKYNSEKISLTPKGGRGKFYLFNRQGKVSLAIGDMGASLIAMRKSINESVELDEVKTRSLTNPMKPAGKAGKTEFAVVAKASGMFIKAFSTEKIARQYIKNQYSVRKKLKGKLGIIEVPLGANIVSNQMKRFGKIEVVKESVEQLDEYGVHTQKTGGEHHPSSGKYAIKLSKSAEG